MNVLYSDEDIVVAEKPAGIGSQRTDKGEDMLTMLSAAGQGDCFPVHRLDTNTSGLIVYAKNKKAAAALSVQFAASVCGKSYYAVVCGTPEKDAATLENLLFHDRAKNKTYVVKRERKGVKKASLSYETLRTCRINGKEVSLLLVTLHTGRTHQIRAQLGAAKHPLTGDGKYGAAGNLPFMLCCRELTFTHPSTGEKMTFTLECPFLNYLSENADE